MINGSIAIAPPYRAARKIRSPPTRSASALSSALTLLSLARWQATRKVNSSLACMTRLPSQDRDVRALDTQGRLFVWFEDELEEKVAGANLGSHPHLTI